MMSFTPSWLSSATALAQSLPTFGLSKVLTMTT
jgi:hypothetical protein